MELFDLEPLIPPEIARFKMERDSVQTLKQRSGSRSFGIAAETAQPVLVHINYHKGP
jgi:hypothetical protein